MAVNRRLGLDSKAANCAVVVHNNPHPHPMWYGVVRLGFDAAELGALTLLIGSKAR